MSWEPYAGPIPLTPETLPAAGRTMHGSTPWPVPERETAVQISRWDVPDFDGRALCAESDPGLFFPDKGGTAVPGKRVCARCLARVECLRWAIDHDERDGVWGGLSAEERNRLRRRRAA